MVTARMGSTVVSKCAGSHATVTVVQDVQSTLHGVRHKTTNALSSQVLYLPSSIHENLNLPDGRVVPSR